MHRRLWIATFVTLAGLLVAALTAQTLLSGTPAPLLLALTVMASSAAIAYPLATAEWNGTCRACGQASLGLGEFGFCLRCGVAAPERSS